MFVCLIIRFRQFGAEKFVINFFFKYLKKVIQNHLKRKKKLKKIHLFPFPPGFGSGSAKKCGSETLDFKSDLKIKRYDAYDA